MNLKQPQPHDSARSAKRRRRIFAGQRDRLRGFSVNKKALSLAIGIEAAIIAAGGYAGWLFAVKYTAGTGEQLPTDVAAIGWWPLLQNGSGGVDFWMAIVAAAMLCAAELARIPLAAATRAHRHWSMRILAIIGVLAMVVVTTKTVGTVLGQAYHVRRVAVIEATAEVTSAEAELARIQATRGSADTALQPLQVRVDQANKRIGELTELIKAQGKAPGQVCVKTPHRDRKTGKRWTTTSCSTPPWAGQQLVDKLDAATAERDQAVSARDAAAGKVGGEVERVADQDKVVAAAKAKQRTAVTNSQLHDFAGIILGKDAVDISEAELNWFLRLFVLVPSLLIAAASTMLAMVAFTRHKQPREIQPIIVQLPGALRGAASDSGPSAAPGGTSRAVVAAPSLLEA